MATTRERIDVEPTLCIDDAVRKLQSYAVMLRLNDKGCVDCIVNGELVSSDEVPYHLMEAYIPTNGTCNPYNVGYVERSDKCLEFIPHRNGENLPPGAFLIGLPLGVLNDTQFKRPDPTTRTPDNTADERVYMQNISSVRGKLITLLTQQMGLYH